MPSISNSKILNVLSKTEQEAAEIVNSRLLRAEKFLIDDRNGNGSFLDTLVESAAWSRPFAIGAVKEYKRFMILQSLNSISQFSPSMIVDSVWHLHLLYTVNYQQFCRLVLDTDFVHHDPSKGGHVEQKRELHLYRETLIAYAQTFSVHPPIDYWGSL